MKEKYKMDMKSYLEGTKEKQNLSNPDIIEENEIHEEETTRNFSLHTPIRTGTLI